MDGWFDGWMDELMDVWINEWMNVHVRLDELMNSYGWINEPITGWMD